jgi:arylsulfatase
MSNRLLILLTLGGLSLAANQSLAQQPLAAQSSKPNILVIWGDDIGFWNVSVYSHGAMGYRTPNIDRIGKEGAVFSDHYAQPSRTAGRAAFITGQLPIRSGMVTVGTPGSPLGLKPQTVTLAEVLKSQGYATGQFGKNQLVIATNTCLPYMASMSSSGTCIT